MFIQAALESRGVDMSSNYVGISANEVCFDDQGVGTGRISKHEGNDRGIRTAQDKQREMRIMVNRWKEGPESDGRIIVGVIQRLRPVKLICGPTVYRRFRD